MLSVASEYCGLSVATAKLNVGGGAATSLRQLVRPARPTAKAEQLSRRHIDVPPPFMIPVTTLHTEYRTCAQCGVLARSSWLRKAGGGCFDPCVAGLRG